MEMNTMLSTPSTTSRNMRVTKLIHASGVAKMERSMKAKAPSRLNVRHAPEVADKKRLMAQRLSALRHESCNFRYARSCDHDVERTAGISCLLLPHGLSVGYHEQPAAAMLY